MRRTLVAALATAGAVALVAGSAVAPAAADTTGYWYYDGLGVPAAQAQGLTGKGVTVGVVDEQINRDVPALADADLHVHEPGYCAGAKAVSTDVKSAYHTTNIAALIAGNGSWYDGAEGPKGVAPGARVNVYAAADGVEGDNALTCSGDKQGTALADAIDQAVADGCDIISISQTTPGVNTPFRAVEAIARALKAGVIVIAGTADNPSQTQGFPFPSRANGVVAVGAFDAQVKLMTYQGSPVIDQASKVVAPGVGLQLGGNRTDDWKTTRLGTGTSYAAPITAGVLALVKQKYPKATNAQLIQSLIRNTSAEDHDLVYQPETGYGYGPVSLSHLLKVDPTQYPDVNPLISDSENAVPTAKQISDAKPADVASATPSSDPSDEPGAADGMPGWLVIVLVVGGVVLLLVIAGVIVAIVLATRRRGGA